ncbi:MAG TPA: hypothetical protein VFC39_04620 [Acidobacteriaceae bacterium]|nr:hypothetical protein [Acidobacteriaceae bacterium]
MDLLERYLQAVGQYLPEATKDDTLAELRENLLAQMEAREEELGRPLTEAETAAILKSHGKPETVAVRYLPQRSLIGPTVYPFYVLTLTRVLPLVVLACAIAQSVQFVNNGHESTAHALVSFALGMWPSLLISAAIVTVIFAVIEWSLAKGKLANRWNEWDPAKLPAVKAHPAGALTPQSVVKRAIDLAAHCLWMAFVLLIPYHPFLILGPGAYYLPWSGWMLAPVWHEFYIVLLCLLTLQLVMKVAALMSGAQRWVEPLGWVVKLLGLAILVIMVTTSVYFVPASAAVDLQSLATINHAVGLGFRVVLVISVIMLLVDLWKERRRWIPAGKLAF